MPFSELNAGRRLSEPEARQAKEIGRKGGYRSKVRRTSVAMGTFSAARLLVRAAAAGVCVWLLYWGVSAAVRVYAG